MSSVLNSSSQPLAGDAEFPGAWEFLTVDKHGVEVVCSTDAPGNLVIEFSQNKIDINYTHTFTIEADVSFSRAVSKKGNYYKVRLINGPSAQTTLQLVTIIQTTYQPDTMDVELDSATSSITIFGQDSDGTKRVVKTTTDGSLVISGGGSGGGDASSANQTLQLTQATNSNLALCQRLDSIDTSANNMEVVLDEMVFTTGNLHVRDDRTLTELQGSNLAQYTKLGLIATSTENMELALDGVSLKLNELQLQSAKYTIEAAPSLAPDTSPAFTAPVSGIPKSEGWYFKNTGVSQPSQVYYYSYTNQALQVPGRQFAYQLNSISCGYAVVRLFSINATLGLPTLAIYTRPTGSGDAFPGYYKSKKVYSIPSTAKLTQGMKVMLWWGIQPSLKLHGDIARLELELSSTTGTAAGTELLAYLTVQTDSAALAGNAEYILGAAGFQFGDEIIMDSTFTGESSTTSTAGDATASNQVSSNTAICARLDSANLTITNSNLALASRLTTLSSNIGQLYFTGSNLQVQDQKLSSELSSLNSTIGQGIYVNMETDPVVSGGVKLHGSTDGNLFVYDAQSNTTLGLIYDEALATNGVLSDLVSGTQQMWVRVDALNDDSVGIYGYSPSLSMPEAIYTVDNAAKVYVDNVVNSLLLAKNPVDNNVNLLTDIDQRLLCNVVVDGSIPITTSTALDVHIYGSTDGTPGNWHHVKCNPNGVVSTNAVMETDANGALTSTSVSGTETYNALDVRCRGTTSVSGGVSATLTTSDNGLLTSTLSGTGNSVHSLDVAVQNSVSVQNVSSTQLAVKSAQFGSYGNIYNLATVNPYTPSSSIDVSAWAYYTGYYEDSFVGSHSYPQALRIQYSFDNINWYNIFNTTIYPSSGAGGINTATIYKQDIPGINYLRFYNDTSDILPNVKLTVMGASN